MPTRRPPLIARAKVKRTAGPGMTEEPEHDEDEGCEESGVEHVLAPALLQRNMRGYIVLFQYIVIQYSNHRLGNVADRAWAAGLMAGPDGAAIWRDCQSG
jgi:hypothetical protein